MSSPKLTEYEQQVYQGLCAKGEDTSGRDNGLFSHSEQKADALSRLEEAGLARSFTREHSVNARTGSGDKVYSTRVYVPK